MKTYTIKHTFNGYELTDRKTNTIVAIFHFAHGFRCLHDVVDYVLDNFDVFKIRAHQIVM